MSFYYERDVVSEWHEKKRRENMRKSIRNEKDAQIELMRLVGRKDMLRKKLGELDPSRRKENKKIVDINIQLKHIDEEIEFIMNEYNVNVEELDYGTQFGKFIGSIKGAIKRGIKKIKKFMKKHDEIVATVFGFIGTFVCGFILKKFGLF